MFELFKRSKIRDWEIRLLKNIINQLPAEFKTLEEQIDAGLLDGILATSDVPFNYVGFSYNQKVFSTLSTDAESNYTITGIRVFDKKSQSQLLYSVYVSHGLIDGYSVKGADNFSLDVDKADVSWFVQVFQQIQDLNNTKMKLKSKK